MRAGYLSLCRLLDRLALWLCGGAGLLLAVMVLVNVVLRYGFGEGSIRMQDLAGYAFAVFLVLSLPVTLSRGGHVRVEVISERMPAGYLRAADGVALLVFLIPMFGLIIWAGWADLAYAFRIREGSVTPGGLGGLWLVKAALPVAAVLMILQGVAVVLAPQAQPDGNA